MGDSGDMKLSAILDRLDEMEAKLIEPAQSHGTGLDERELDHNAFSDVSDMFEGARDRGC